MKLQIGNIAEKLKKNKYIIIMIAVGLILILWPGGGSKTKSPENSETDITNISFSLEENEKKLERILAKIDGAGDVSVMLSVEGSTERIVAENIKKTEERSDGALSKTEERESVVVGSGADEGLVDLSYIFPEYRGAVVVAEGAESSSVRLSIVQAVGAITGLASDRISVIKMEKP